jgi:hypothetical protein
MSYHCPSCQGILYDRKVSVCAHCGADLPPESLFLPSEVEPLDGEAPGIEVPVALLARTWTELSRARGDSKASRQAALRYFRDGLGGGFPSQLLLRWLFFWPNERESAFGQAAFSAQQGEDFIQMVKKLTIEDALGSDDESPATTAALAKLRNIPTEKICAEARAQIMWGEPASAVRAVLASQGVSLDEADARVREFSAARNAQIRRIGLRTFAVGLAVLCGGAAALYPCFRFFDALTDVNRPIFVLVSAALGIYGTSKLVKGTFWLLRPQAEHKSVSEIAR